jgi:hypothetical protein
MFGQVCLVLDKEVLPVGRGIGLRDGGDGPISHDVVGFGVRTKKKLFIFVYLKYLLNMFQLVSEQVL